jgi:hypothetical protein
VNAHDAEPRRAPRGGACVAHTFAAHVRACPERLSYVLQSGPYDPPTYLTWLIRPTPGGCTIRLEIDEVDNADSRQDAEDVWLPVLAALQHLLNPG